MLLLLLAGCPMYDKERLEWVYTQLEDDDGDGFREIDGDCDDTNPDAHPGQYEVCNGFDDDCNGDADGDALDIQLWYQDRDGDGYGSDVLTRQSCTEVPTFANKGGDCDEEDTTIHPDAETVCGEDLDRDCDGVRESVDQDRDGSPWCADCNDFDPSISPLVIERCNEQDDDCDGQIDEAGATLALWYPDVDGDGYGDEDAGVEACDRPQANYTLQAGDCDDGDSEVRPGGTEVCGDGLDNDCDGSPGACRFEGELQESASVVTGDGLRYDVPYGLSLGNIGDWNGDGLDDIYAQYSTTSEDGSYQYGLDFFVGPFDRYEIAASDGRMAWIPPSDTTNLYLHVLGDAQQTGDGTLLLTGTNYASLVRRAEVGELSPSNGLTDVPTDIQGFCIFASTGDVTGNGTDALIINSVEVIEDTIHGYASFRALPVDQHTGITNRTALIDAPGNFLFTPWIQDINQDGFDDIVGYNRPIEGASAADSVFTFLGPLSAPLQLSDADTNIRFEETEVLSGSPPGDADADGSPDIWLVTTTRTAYSVPIRIGSYDAADEFRLRLVSEPNLQEDSTETYFGRPTVQDIDEDGSDDVVVTRADWYSQTDLATIGKVYFLYGPVSGSIDLADADATVTGSSYLEVENLGWSMLTGYFDDQDGLDIFLASYVSNDVWRTDRLGLYTHDW